MASTGLPWYYIPVIFLGGLILVLVFLVFLHWLAQFWLDTQEKDNADNIIDSDDDSDFESPFEKYKSKISNKLRREKAQIPANQKRSRAITNPAIEILKVPSDTSSVSSKSAKVLSNTRLAVSLSIKHFKTNMVLSGNVKGVIGLPLPGKGGPDKIYFKLRLNPNKREKSLKTSHYIPLETKMIIPFQFKFVKQKELNKTVLHMRLFGKANKFGLPLGSDHCFGEAFVSLADLATGIEEANIVQEIIPLGSKPFNRESMKIRISSPKIVTRTVPQQMKGVTSDGIDVYIGDENKSQTGSDRRETENKSQKYLVYEDK